MKALVPFTLAALALSAAQGYAQGPKDPSGVWLTKDGEARIRVEKCGPSNGELCGYVVWIKDPLTPEGKPRTDIKNPDPSKRSRLSLGHQIMLGLKPDAEGRYVGQIYNSMEGKNYDVSVWLEGPNEFRVRGCFMSILCGSQAWTKVTDVAQGQLTGPTGGPNGPRPDPQWAKPATAASAKPAPATTSSTTPAR
jgi:uncharacterized protein (DUF2147 family)